MKTVRMFVDVEMPEDTDEIEAAMAIDRALVIGCLQSCNILCPDKNDKDCQLLSTMNLGVVSAKI